MRFRKAVGVVVLALRIPSHLFAPTRWVAGANGQERALILASVRERRLRSPAAASASSSFGSSPAEPPQSVPCNWQFRARRFPPDMDATGIPRKTHPWGLRARSQRQRPGWCVGVQLGDAIAERYISPIGHSGTFKAIMLDKSRFSAPGPN
jgi:hypothetical protein